MTPLQQFQDKIGVEPDNDFGKITLKAGTKHLRLSNEQGAHFFAQLAHETGNFRTYEENLNYSANGLMATFKKYFTRELAEQYARKPEMIANRVYASRMGNGNEASGDGWKYRGRGFLQLTGRYNYALFAGYVLTPEIIENPDLVIRKYAMESAQFYFDRNKLWNKCTIVDDYSILKVTKAINGGTNGLEHRTELTNKYYNWLNS